MTTTEASDTKRVLELLSQGKITVDEAEQLLGALKDQIPADGAATGSPRWVRITMHRGPDGQRPEKNVNVRVPIALARSGIKLGAMFNMFNPRLQDELRKQGVEADFSKINFAELTKALDDLGETTIDVDDGKAQIRVRCE
jgi:hypothetical protein